MLRLSKFFCILFVLITTILYLFHFQQIIRTQHLIFIFRDPTIPVRVDRETNEDHGSNHILETRIFHNKVMLSLNNVFVSLSQGLDPVFLFSLSSDTFFPDNDEQSSPLLPAIEFPFFVVAFITLIRQWNKKYRFLLWMVGISLAIQSLFLPVLSPLKLLPWVITIQTITFLGVWEFATNFKNKEKKIKKK